MFCSGCNSCYWESFQILKYYKDTLWRATDLCKALPIFRSSPLILHQNFRSLLSYLSHGIDEKLYPPDIATTVLGRPKQVEIFILILAQMFGQAY